MLRRLIAALRDIYDFAAWMWERKPKGPNPMVMPLWCMCGELAPQEQWGSLTYTCEKCRVKYEPLLQKWLDRKVVRGPWRQ